MELSDLAASRLLFGLTAAFHFLFVPVTIGLAALIALFEALALATGRVACRDAARFCTWPFLLHFACGVLTGYPLRHQLATNWSAFSHVVGPVFAEVFSFEGHVAPVMLTLVALVAFGGRLHAAWRVAAATALAAVLVVQSAGILMLNAWMQLPVGTVFVDGQARVTDLAALAGNPLFAPKVLHTVAGAWVLGGTLVTAVAAAWLLRGRHDAVARCAFHVGSRFTLVALVLTGIAGHWSGERLVTHQPMKFAAIEALWDTDGTPPDLVLFAWPDMAARTNRHAWTWPGGLGQVLAEPGAVAGLRQLGDGLAATLRREAGGPWPADAGPALGAIGLLDPAARANGPTDRDLDEAARHTLPDVPRVFWSFRVMLGCWGVLLVVMLAACLQAADAMRPRSRLVLRACVWAWPLPWIATEAGWFVCEAGRQPWAVTGVLTTRASLGGVTSADVLAQLQVAVPIAVMMLLVNGVAMALHVRRGPGAGRWPGLTPAHRAGGAAPVAE